MQTAYHYLRIRNHFRSVAEGERIETSLQELADILCCSTRNVKMIIKQLTELKWMQWISGRGRGNFSQLCFLVKADDVVLLVAQHHVKRGDLNEALDTLRQYGVRSTAKERFFAWLSQQFGFRVEEAERQPRDTLRMPLYRPIPALDPAYVSRRTESHMVKQVFDTLIRYDAKTDRILPHIAHYWEANRDGTEWTLYLRKGVLFHHGRELKAEDARLTLERIRDPAARSPHRWMFSDVTEIRCPSDTVLRIRLSRPNRLFLHFLCSSRASIIPYEVLLEKGERFAAEPVGTGPFRLVRNDDTMFVLEAFPPYFQGRAHLDRIEIWIVPDLPPNRITEQAGTEPLHIHPFREWAEASPQWKGIEKVEMGCKYISFNLNRPGPQQSLMFRRALDALIDRRRMVHELGPNWLFPAFGLLPEKKEQQGEVSREEGCRLLAESGYRGEVLTMYTYEGAGNERDAQWVQEHCREAGINMAVRALPIEVLQQPGKAAEADLIIAGEVFDEDLQFELTEVWQRENSFIRAHWNPSLRERIDRQIARVLRMETKEKRMEELRRVEHLLQEESALLFLYHTRQTSTYYSALEGVSLNALGWIDYKDIWFK
jgi:SgrR family transcriptional regulator